MNILHLAAWSTLVSTLLGLFLIHRHGQKLPQLPEHPTLPPVSPGVCLCIPVRDEAAELQEAITSWLGQDYSALMIIAVDDGSTDGSSELLEQLVRARPDRLKVLRNDHLPPGWLGKNHALHRASEQAEANSADWLLFADADVKAAPEVLRRAMAFALAQPTDILALVPAIDTDSRSERIILPLASSLFLALVPPHRIPNPRHPSFCGVGAFTLVRRAAYDAVGGHAAAPLEAIDDMMLARRVKRAGFVNRVAQGGPGLHLRMYHGLSELVKAMRKNSAALPFWPLIPCFLPGMALIGLGPLWLPFAGFPVTAVLLWLLVPAVFGDSHQRLTRRPMDPLWALWPLATVVMLAGTTWAFIDRLRGVNHWRGREVKLR